MAEDWSSIATEIAGEIADIGFDVVIEQPSDTNIGTEADPEYGPAIEHSVKAIERMLRKKDAEGVVTETVRSLMVPTGTVVPQKGYRIQVRGKWHRIQECYTLAPGGVDLMYRIELVS